MGIGLPRQHPDPQEGVTSPYAVWVKDSLEVAFDQVRRNSGQAVQRQKRLYDQRAVRRLFAIGDWVMRYYPTGKKSKLDSVWTGPYLVVALLRWTVGIQKHPDVPVILIHCQDVKKVPKPCGVQLWIATPSRWVPRRSLCWVLVLWPTPPEARPRLLLCPQMRGLFSHMWIMCAKDVPNRMTVGVGRQVRLRMIPGWLR